MVALVPQIEGDDDSNAFTKSVSGLYMIPLPYAGELRSITSSSSVGTTTPNGIGENGQVVSSVPDEMYNAVNRLVNAQQLEPDSLITVSKMNNNPVLQRFYSTIQAIALNETDTNEMEGKPGTDVDELFMSMLPEHEQQEIQEKQVENAALFQEFKEIFQLETCCCKEASSCR